MSNEVLDWKAQLKKDVKQVQEETVTEGIGFISLRGGRMTYQDQELPGGELECVVVANIAERTMYDRPYDPEDKLPPDCFAQGSVVNALQPHGNVPKPISKNCKACPKAEFGTARVGKGPACKTYRKLVVMPKSTDPATADLAIIRVPPTSVANWTKYTNQLAGQGLPPWAAFTIVKVAPHPKKQFEVTFKGAAPVGDESMLAGIHARIQEAERALFKPYEYEGETKY